jgi:hypothetical protein
MLQESVEPKKQKVLQADWDGIQKVSWYQSHVGSQLNPNIISLNRMLCKSENKKPNYKMTSKGDFQVTLSLGDPQMVSSLSQYNPRIK